MSRTITDSRELRLHLSSSVITLVQHAPGHAPREIDRAGVADPALGAALARLARRAAEAGVPLVAVLPRSELRAGWLAGPLTRPGLRRLGARRALGLGAGRYAMAFGAPDAGGRLPVAAVPHASLADARRFLAAHDLRPTAFAGEIGVDGFADSPRFGEAPLPAGLARLRDALRRASAPRPARPGLPALGAAALLVLAGVIAMLGGAPEGPADPVRVAEAPAEPAPEVDRANAGPRPDTPAIAAEAPEAAADREPTSTALARQRQPMERPARPVVPALPPAVAEAEGAPVVQAGRNLPPALSAAVPETEDRPVLGRVAPAPRPGPAGEPKAEPAAPAVPPLAGPQPRPRPAAEAPASPDTTAESAELAPTPDPLRPRSRPGAIAGLAEAAGTAAPAAEPTPQASLASALALATAAPPEPRQVARPAASRPAPAVTRAAAKPVRVAAAAPAPTRAEPTRRVVRAQPTTVRRVAPAQPTNVRRAAAAPRPGVARAGRGTMSLVGVFGRPSDRHALVQLPNGEIERVEAGQTVYGVQVAAVGPDSLRVRVNGRDAVLGMPE